MTLEEQIPKMTTSDQAGHQDVRPGSLLLRDLRSLRQRISGEVFTRIIRIAAREG